MLSVPQFRRGLGWISGHMEQAPHGRGHSSMLTELMEHSATALKTRGLDSGGGYAEPGAGLDRSDRLLPNLDIQP